MQFKSQKRIQSECKFCKKRDVLVVSEVTKESVKFITLSCGHTVPEKLSVTKAAEILLKDGKSLWKYQVTGYHFAEKSGFNCLIADEQGLGKTIQAVALITHHWQELKPILIVVKGSLTVQWQKHILLGAGRFAQILVRNTEPIKELGIWIVSWDMTLKLEPKIRDLKVKTVIGDEVQMIKSHDAKRTQGIREICK